MAGRKRGRGQTREVRGSSSKTVKANALEEEMIDSVVPPPSDYQKIYMQLSESERFNVKDLASLEISQFLETQLWPNFDPETSEKSHIMLIVMMVNEKFREKLAAWDCFKSRPNDFKRFFSQVLDMSLSDMISIEEKTHILVFLIHCFNSLEVKLVRDELGDLISIRIWSHLSHHRLNEEFKRYPKFEKMYKKSVASIQKLDERDQLEAHKLASFIPKIMDHFKSILFSQVDVTNMIYIERFLELFTDIESSLVTRRFVDTLLDDKYFAIYLLTSSLYKSKEASLYHQLVDNFCFCHRFQVDTVSGCDYSELESVKMHYERFEALQRTTFVLFPNILSDFYLSNVASVDSKEDLIKHFSVLTDEQLLTLMKEVGLIYDHENCSESESYSREFLMTLLVWKYQKIESQLSQINRTPLYPTESMIWNENLIPSESYNGESCLSLPKLNLQFLTLHDYLLRNFHLFRYESTYEIKINLEDSISRMNPIQGDDGLTVFTGWARMALPINQFVVSHIGRNNLGQNYPSRVMADVTIDIKMRQDFAFEWQTLRKGDPCFLVAISCAEFGENKQKNTSLSFAERFGVRHVRGCEIYGMLDEDGQVIDETVGAISSHKFTSSKRVYRVFLDCCQYQLDTDSFENGGSDVYSSLNLIMRRKQKENNFKAVLETIRSLMNTECVVPDWLLSTFLGYESLSSEDISSEGECKTINFCDTFLDVKHIYRSFSDCKIENTLDATTPDRCVLDAVLTFSGQNDKSIKIASKASVDGDDVYSSYSRMFRHNTIPFTCSQVKAIKSAMQQGLTLIVGPPGTGKTDVAVQIISNLYHSFPNQRTLIVAHSNQALNQIFEKIIALNIDEKHCLRLGHGEEMLETEKDFSRKGRVNYVLTRRLQLLREVERLQHSLQIPGDMSFTCETAVQFFSNQILPRWNKFLKICTSHRSDCSSSTNAENGVESNQFDFQQQFPFIKFINEWYSANSDHFNVSLFDSLSSTECLSRAKQYFKHIKSIFDELDEFRPFELLRNSVERSKYLLLKTAKIIAMTCTHASLRRSDLVELCFKYDNVLMEESGQILEIETFIPLLLQNPENNKSRLKRVTLIGDHHQLPPVVKNMGFKRFSNLEQSLFARLIRVGVPFIELDAQGRSRESICKLFSWRYANLSSLPHVLSKLDYLAANAGFMYTYQLINVEDLNGVGESEPTPFFYQNLAEAEYAVNLFIYMRVLGYPANSITIITTYNGQKHLIRDVLKQKTASNPLLGIPHKVTTVDRYQGQQNDYVIVSLVRTKNVGHIRDVRRLVVALSRARLGLYILGRVSLFSTCFELSHAISLLCQHPTDLVLIPNERFPSLRQESDDESSIKTDDKLVISTIHQLADLTKELYMTHLHYLEEQYRLMQDSLKSLQKDRNLDEDVDEEQNEMDGNMNLEEYGQEIQNEVSEN